MGTNRKRRRQAATFAMAKSPATRPAYGKTGTGPTASIGSMPWSALRLLRWKRASNRMRMWAFTRDTTCNTALTNMSMACYRQTLSAQLLSSAAYSRSLHLHTHASPQILPDCKRFLSDPHRRPSTVFQMKLNDVRHSQATGEGLCAFRFIVKHDDILHVHRKRQETGAGLCWLMQPRRP